MKPAPPVTTTGAVTTSPRGFSRGGFYRYDGTVHTDDAWFESALEPRRRRPVLLVLAALVAGAAIGIGAISIDRGAIPPFRPAVHDMALADLTRADHGV